MRRTLVLACLLGVMAGSAWAQQGLLVKAETAEGTVIKLIPVNYLDVRALAEALGGTTISLYGFAQRGERAAAPTSWEFRPNPTEGGAYLIPPPNGPGQAAPAARPAISTGLNPNAPLAPFVPREITQILGIAY